jgi:hypothetical protein
MPYAPKWEQTGNNNNRRILDNKSVKYVLSFIHLSATNAIHKN